MERLTDEQRDTVTEWVPYARKLAAIWASRRGIAGYRFGEVESAFLLGLMVAVRTYDATRGASLKTHLFLKCPRAAVDALRAEWGREGEFQTDMRRRTTSLSRRIAGALSPTVARGVAVSDMVECRGERPDARARASDVVAAVRRNLPAVHARVLIETVLGGRTLEDVCAECGFGKTRASQLRAEAVEVLRSSRVIRGML